MIDFDIYVVNFLSYFTLSCKFIRLMRCKYYEMWIQHNHFGLFFQCRPCIFIFYLNSFTSKEKKYSINKYLIIIK